MDCRTFRKKHVAFVDDTLPGFELAEMYRHLEECERCGHHDSTLRRGLMLVRSLPTIEPSCDFSARLAARLRDARLSEEQTMAGTFGRFSALASFSVLAAGLAVGGYVGYVASIAANLPHTARELTLAPVIASQPEPASLPFASPALVASFSSGVPLWPTALLAEETPVQFVNTQFTATR